MSLIAAFTIIATIIPFILGHVVTVEIIEHQILHVAAITFGIFLVIISIHSSMITKNSQMILDNICICYFYIVVNISSI